MAIKEKGYIGWDGQLQKGSLAWFPILLQGIRTVWKKKRSKIVFFLTGFPFLIFGAAIFALNKPELKFLTEVIRTLKSDRGIFNTFFTFPQLVFMLMILAAFSGSELISADLKYRALPLYFSRPLSKWDYLVGKLSIIFFYLLCFSLVPGILLVALKFLFSGSLAISFRLLMGILFFPLIISFFLASLTLFLSSLSANTKLITIIIFIVYIFNDGFAELLRTILKNDHYYLLSIQKNIIQLGAFFFGTGKSWKFPLWYTPALLVGMSLILLGLLYIKLRKVESQA